VSSRSGPDRGNAQNEEDRPCNTEGRSTEPGAERLLSTCSTSIAGSVSSRCAPDRGNAQNEEDRPCQTEGRSTEPGAERLLSTWSTSIAGLEPVAALLVLYWLRSQPRLFLGPSGSPGLEPVAALLVLYWLRSQPRLFLGPSGSPGWNQSLRSWFCTRDPSRGCFLVHLDHWVGTSRCAPGSVLVEIQPGNLNADNP
jgi:hypothetical protein